MIIVIANSKGGVGKSTLAVHLAGWLHEQGHRVALADCDTQHSSSDWLREAMPAVKTIRLGSPDEILDELPQIASEVDYLIADGESVLFRPADANPCENRPVIWGATVLARIPHQ